MISAGEKSAVVKKFARSNGDTGSVEVQVALLTQKLEQLTKHAAKHPQDKHSARGLQGVVSKRKHLLKYLSDRDVNRYRALINELGLRK